jgi:TetR/AcrR family transcriptional regulator, repressor of fatR-cypB operon
VDKKEQIIVAAMKLLVEKGIQATPMSAIAKAAGTGMGTIYNYFATKEELINAIYLHVKGSEIELILNSIDPNTSLKAKFLSYYTAFVNFYLKYPESFDFIDQMHNSPVIQPLTKEQGKAAFLPVIQLIQQGQDEGIIKKMELEALLHFLAGTITSYVRWMLSTNLKDQITNLDQQVRMVWDAIKE